MDSQDKRRLPGDVKTLHLPAHSLSCVKVLQGNRINGMERESRASEGGRGREREREGGEMGRLKNLHLFICMGTVGVAESGMSGLQLGQSLKAH